MSSNIKGFSEPGYELEKLNATKISTANISSITKNNNIPSQAIAIFSEIQPVYTPSGTYILLEKSTLKELLISIFSKELIEKVFDHEIVRDIPDKTRIDINDYFKIYSLIAHNISYDTKLNDLQYLWNNIRKNEETLLRLPKNLQDEKENEKIEDLSEENLNLLYKIHTDPLYFFQTETKMHLEKNLNIFLQNFKNFFPHKYHYLFTCITNNYSFYLTKEKDQSENTLLHIGTAENLSKIIRNGRSSELSKNMLFHIYDESLDKLVIYQLSSKLFIKGLNFILLKPISDEEAPLITLFRGTNIYDKHSFIRDLDITGIGKSEFNKYKNDLLNLIYLTKSKSLKVIGHSLGAVDSQRLIAAIYRDMAEEKEKTIDKIDGYFFSSPKLDLETYTQFQKDLKAFPDLKLNLNFVQHKDDPVIRSGSKNLSLINPNKENNSEIYVVVSTTDRIFKNSIDHHRKRFFKNDGHLDLHKRKYHIIDEKKFLSSITKDGLAQYMNDEENFESVKQLQQKINEFDQELLKQKENSAFYHFLQQIINYAKIFLVFIICLFLASDAEGQELIEDSGV